MYRQPNGEATDGRVAVKSEDTVGVRVGLGNIRAYVYDRKFGTNFTHFVGGKCNLWSHLVFRTVKRANCQS